MDIVNLKKAMSALAKLGNLAGNVMEDGKVTATDLTYVLSFIMELPNIASISFKDLPVEFSDLTIDEVTELKNLFKTEFDIPEDKVEGVIESGLEVLAVIFAAYITWKNANKK